MELKFQYNKISIQALQKQLKIRQAALPTLKSKETYLRINIKKEKNRLDRQRGELEELRKNIGESEQLFSEYPTGSLRVMSIEYGSKNIAGITIPSLEKISFTETASSLIQIPSWLLWGWKVAKHLIRIITEIDVTRHRIERLELARKKTTQKVNLYEKVQIPQFSNAILKIKRYLEDVENLDKAAQKITKARQIEASVVR